MKYSKEITAFALAIFSIFAIVNYIVNNQDRINRSKTSPQVLVVPDVQERVEEKQPIVYEYEGTYEARGDKESSLILKINGGGAGTLESYENGKHITGFGDWNKEEVSLIIKGDNDKGSYAVPLVLRFFRGEDGSLTLIKESSLLKDENLVFRRISEENDVEKK
jgi:hypothetical protein